MQYIHLFPAQMLTATQDLNNVQKAVFWTLFLRIADSEKPIPTDESFIRRILRLNNVRIRNFVEDVLTVLNRFFDIQNDGYHLMELDRQIQLVVSGRQKHGSKRVNFSPKLTKTSPQLRHNSSTECEKTLINQRGCFTERVNERMNERSDVPSSGEQSSPQTSRKGLITLVGRYCDERDLANLPEKITQYLFADEERGIQIMEWIIANGINLEEYVF